VVERRFRRVDDVARQVAHVGVVGARLDEHHRATGVLAQSRGENTTGGTSTDDEHFRSHSTGRIRAARFMVGDVVEP